MKTLVCSNGNFFSVEDAENNLKQILKDQYPDAAVDKIITDCFHCEHCNDYHYESEVMVIAGDAELTAFGEQLLKALKK